LDLERVTYLQDHRSTKEFSSRRKPLKKGDSIGHMKGLLGGSSARDLRSEACGVHSHGKGLIREQQAAQAQHHPNVGESGNAEKNGECDKVTDQVRLILEKRSL